MTTKKATLDLEAHERLKAHRRADGSFSQTLKRLTDQRVDLDALLAVAAEPPLSY